MGSNNTNKLVAYIDVLGFSNAINQNIDDINLQCRYYVIHTFRHLQTLPLT